MSRGRAPSPSALHQKIDTMLSNPRFGILLCAAVILTQDSSAAHAQRAVAKLKLSLEEERAVDAYLQILRNCCMQDGGINMVDHGPAVSSPVWVAPYFADHVALALLAANNYNASVDDVARVGRWVEWRLKRQEKGGFWCDYTGTKAKYSSTDEVDASDSSAAFFLMVLERYQHSGGVITGSMITAAKASLKGIIDVTDQDGLTWAKPNYRVKYLLDNIEVYAGLKAGETFFSKTKDALESRDCGDRASVIGKLLPAYFAAKEKERFAWALHPDGTFAGGMDRLYPHGLAQLFGVAFVKSDADMFKNVVKDFAPETGPTAIGAERFLVTASRLSDEFSADWRRRVLKDKSLLNAKSTYNYRPALAILALLEGAHWMPSLLD
jgi:hypothetical protein